MSTASYRERNREKINAAERERWARKHHDRSSSEHLRTVARLRDHRNRLKRLGISIETYDKIFRDQNGLCAICHQPETELDKRYGTKKRLTADHCHLSKKVRGLLCAKCNRGLGILEDNITFLMSAVDYLKRAQAT